MAESSAQSCSARCPLLGKKKSDSINDSLRHNFTLSGHTEKGVLLNITHGITKRVISFYVNLRYLWLKLLKYKENIKKIYDTFDHNSKNSPLYNKLGIIQKALFCIIWWCPYFKISKIALNLFCDETLEILLMVCVCVCVILKRRNAMVTFLFTELTLIVINPFSGDRVATLRDYLHIVGGVTRLCNSIFFVLLFIYCLDDYMAFYKNHNMGFSKAFWKSHFSHEEKRS